MVGNTVDDLGSVVSRIDMNAEGTCAEGHIDDVDDSLCHIQYIGVRCRSQREAFYDLLSQIGCRSRFILLPPHLILRLPRVGAVIRTRCESTWNAGGRFD